MYDRRNWPFQAWANTVWENKFQSKNETPIVDSDSSTTLLNVDVSSGKRKIVDVKRNR